MFLDANVLVSAALKEGSALARLWELPGVRLLGSPHVRAEARRNVPEAQAAARLEVLLEQIVVLPSEPADAEVTGDPGLPAADRQVLLGAIAARADYLLTGDITHFGPCLGEEVAGVRVMLPGAYLRAR